MSTRNTLIRALHDVGTAVWLGGSLMGAVALNGSASDIQDPAERATIAANGWARWTPINVGAITAHLIGGAGLVALNRDRVRNQRGVTANTAAKTAITATAMAATAYSGILGARIAASERAFAAGATTPGIGTPEDVAQAQNRLKILQWVTPALTGLIVVMGAQQGEQQRAAEVVRGKTRKAIQRSLTRG